MIFVFPNCDFLQNREMIPSRYFNAIFLWNPISRQVYIKNQIGWNWLKLPVYFLLRLLFQIQDQGRQYHDNQYKR